MDTVNSLLIHGATALLWLWGSIGTLLGRLWSVLDAILDPILSPVLAVLNPVCTVVGDMVYAVLSPVPVWLGLTVLSVLSGVVMLVAFRYVSNQKAIGRAKDDIKANLLALKLYKDDLRVMFHAQGRLLWAILRLQRYVLTPVLVMLLPMLLGLAQMGTRYQWRPLHSGERTLIRMRLKEGVESAATGLSAVDRRYAEDARYAPVADAKPGVTLESCAGLIVEVGPIPGGGEMVWRVRGGKPGRYQLRFHVGDDVVEKELVVGEGLRRVSAIRVGNDWTTQLLHPAERRLPDRTDVESIEIVYPGVDSRVYGANWWVLSFFVISMAAALILKPVFRVRF